MDLLHSFQVQRIQFRRVSRKMYAPTRGLYTTADCPLLAKNNQTWTAFEQESETFNQHLTWYLGWQDIASRKLPLPIQPIVPTVHFQWLHPDPMRYRQALDVRRMHITPSQEVQSAGWPLLCTVCAVINILTAPNLQLTVKRQMTYNLPVSLSAKWC